MEILKYLGKLFTIFVGFIAIFFIAMVLIWCIPDEWVMERQQESLSLFDQSGNEHEWPFSREGHGWEWIFTHARGSQLDNGTDYLMILNATIERGGEVSAIYQAMDCNGCARYWHGYFAFLRPLLIFFSYMQIRYIYMFVFILLGMAIMLCIYQHFGCRMAYLWAICSCFIYPVVLPFSMQFSTVFFIMMAAILVIERIYKKISLQGIGMLFLILGMLTSFFDYLTAPVLTLGVPIIYLMLCNCNRLAEMSFGTNMRGLMLASVTWIAGYFGSWGMKWLIASPILKRNVIEEGLSQAAYRTYKPYQTKTGYTAGSFRAILMNLFAILPPGITSADWKWFFCFLSVIILILAVILFKFHAGKRKLKSTIPFVIVAFYPFAWYSVLAQHTSIHYMFTYRMLLITLLGFSIAYGKAIQMHRK